MTRHFALTAIGGLALAACVGGALAVTSTDFTYSSVKTGYYAMPPVDLQPDSASAAANLFKDFGGSLEGDGCYGAGLHLPQQATIVSVTVWYASTPSSDISVTLSRDTPLTGANAVLVSKLLADDTDVRKAFTQNVSASNPARVVNNSNTMYTLGICIDEGSRFFGARIAYTYRNAGD